MKIGQEVFGEEECETGRIVVVWVEGESPKVMAESVRVVVVKTWNVLDKMVVA